MPIKQQDMQKILQMNKGMSEADVEKAFAMNLDDCVVQALKLYENRGIPKLRTNEFKRPLVLGSGNAFFSGKILFEGIDAIFADESTYQQIFKAYKDSIDGVYVLSASGSKHSGELVRYFSKQQGLPTRLITCTPNSDAEQQLTPEDQKHIIVTPKTTELYTYNTSTYMGWLFAKTGENPGAIREFIEQEIDPKIPKDIGGYCSYFIIVPEKFDMIRPMYMTKFDELFMPLVAGQVFTEGQTTHAKTMIPSDTQMFIGLGYDNNRFGNPESRLNIALPENIDYGGMMALGYYIIGKIQAHKPALFKEHIVDYCLNIFQESFGKSISPIIR